MQLGQSLPKEIICRNSVTNVCGVSTVCLLGAGTERVVDERNLTVSS